MSQQPPPYEKSGPMVPMEPPMVSPQTAYGAPPVGQTAYGALPGAQTAYGAPPVAQTAYGAPPVAQTVYAPPAVVIRLLLLHLRAVAGLLPGAVLYGRLEASHSLLPQLWRHPRHLQGNIKHVWTLGTLCLVVVALQITVFISKPFHLFCLKTLVSFHHLVTDRSKTYQIKLIVSSLHL